MTRLAATALVVLALAACGTPRAGQAPPLREAAAPAQGESTGAEGAAEASAEAAPEAAADETPAVEAAAPAEGVRVCVVGTTTWSPSFRPSVMAVCWSLLMPRVTTRDSTLPSWVSTSTAWSRPWRCSARLGTSSASVCRAEAPQP